MPPLAEQDDAALLLRIASERRTAQAESETFYRRHVRYLYAVVKQQCQSLGLSAHETEDLVHDAFQRAFEHAASFRASESEDADEQRRWTRAWLGRIARNLILDALGNRREWVASELIEAAVDAGPPSSMRENPKLRALQEAIATLNEREQDVLRVSALYYRAGEAHPRLPNEVSAELAQRWETNSDNIRAIRMRALKKVQALLRASLTEGASPP
jgi:RNA polymerase sigma factor (sigma-70 family)